VRSGKKRRKKGSFRPSVVVYTDGLCEPRNPGGVACGFVARRGDEKIAQGWGVVCRGENATSNVAGYAAAQAALERPLELGLEKELVEVRSDSQLLVRQYGRPVRRPQSPDQGAPPCAFAPVLTVPRRAVAVGATGSEQGS
jgi:ribonuclease HI